MHSQPNSPVRGSWIWVTTTAAAAIVLLAIAALSYGGSGPCPSGTGRPASPEPGPGRAGTTPRAAVDAAPGASGSLRHAQAGIALYYDPGKVMGSCALGPFPPGGRYVSLPPQQYAHGAACGSYLDVTGPRGKVRAEVVDLCTGCAPTTINLSEAAFDRVANPRPGSATVTYQEVADPPLAAPLVIRVLATGNPGLLALQILNHGNRLVSVELAADSGARAAAAVSPSQGAPGAWKTLPLGSNGFWLSAAKPGHGRFALRITDDRGHQVTARHLALSPGATIRPHLWMYRSAPGQAARPSASSQRAPAAARSAAHC